ncbi:peroxiredoxin-like family protein [Luteibaculum oceani]|uniref:thioredoxin-dependent peroxiredoxin n=1 Tax=Luteibaculum oceani TaxID=1294296 RepID=A0A5C6V2V2_9FLAO|nr:peroxiredoxin-like family protein [Luteibaculum oceani]TXC78806.1 redoxin domain-containing protein [Luteibaculum oceani]
MQRILFPLLLIASLIIGGSVQAQKKSKKEDPAKYGMDDDYKLPKGLKLGSDLPEFTTSTSSGTEINSEDLIKEGPAVILFFRGNWCPVCSKYLSNLNDSLQQITSLGAKVYAISPQNKVANETAANKAKGNIIFLNDENAQIMKAFDVDFKVSEKYDQKIKMFLNTDIAEFNGMENALLPVPATFVFDQSGELVFRHFNFNYNRRAHTKEIINAIKNIKTN